LYTRNNNHESGLPVSVSARSSRAQDENALHVVIGLSHLHV
jgi:hypothetical protein